MKVLVTDSKGLEKYFEYVTNYCEKEEESKNGKKFLFYSKLKETLIKQTFTPETQN